MRLIFSPIYLLSFPPPRLFWKIYTPGFSQVGVHYERDKKNFMDIVHPQKKNSSVKNLSSGGKNRKFKNIYLFTHIFYTGVWSQFLIQILMILVSTLD